MFHLALYLGCAFVGAVALGPIGAIIGLFIALLATFFTDWRLALTIIAVLAIIIASAWYLIHTLA